jgi:dipeptidyl aminopeptidase/acylaminoacyl peptidase
MTRPLWLAAAFSLPVALGLPAPGRADGGYRLPPDPLPALVDAPTTPEVRLSPDRRSMLLLEWPGLLPIAELAEPELRLAGLRWLTRTTGPSRVRHYRRITVKGLEERTGREVSGLPAQARIDDVVWAPDGRRFAFTLTRADRIEPWIADVETATARPLADLALNGVLGTPLAWLDSAELIARVLVPERGAPPPEPSLPAGPLIQENTGAEAPARTYQDLLKNPRDEALFEHYLSARLVRLRLDGTIRPIGEPGLITSFAPSPDGLWLEVECVHRPFSYLVPWYRFPRRIEVWDLAGRPVRLIADLPLQEQVPTQFASAPVGPRAVEWRPDLPAALTWVEALDGGDPRRAAELRDELFELRAPFEEPPTSLVKLELRHADVEWGGESLALVSEGWWKTRRTRTWRIDPSRPAAEPRLVFDRSSEDRYGDPGSPARMTNRYGLPQLLSIDGGKTIFLVGDGASEEGDRPFLDRLDLDTGETERLFHSAAPHYERPVLPLDAQGRTFLTRRESRDEPPNFFVRRTDTPVAPRQVTWFPHPTPQLAGSRKELIRYPRADGVMLTGTLYLPAGYEAAQGPLPVLLWAYPQEFKSADAAGQVTDSPYRFDRVSWSSPLLFLTLGYAVLDDPSMPIVGEGDAEPNDTYVAQLVASAEAAVAELSRRGVGDPGRLAIGGHSYGAFTAANLLAHTSLFRAGIARSGAYNRTLTPFGFQSEERTVWQAPQVYVAMSPFMQADKIDEPILLIHGEADNNSGTFPMQSERFYNALRGLGATTRLVMLPHESHGYRGRESVLHVLWEQASWLDRWVKNAAPPPG